MAEVKPLSFLAESDWRFRFDEYDDNEICIVRPDDPDRPGAFVGPLANLSVGTYEEGDDGEKRMCLESEDGLILYAVAALPQFAELVEFTHEGLGILNGIHFDQTHQLGVFLTKLRRRVDYLRSLINERDETVNASGMHSLQRLPV